ncbi:hypothetical protein RV08_GL000022 [Enterococcus mundtii]|nr:hypothetical protein RV08_GL000022 [Enterococcus mundtii]
MVINKKGKNEDVAVLRDNAWMPPHKKGTAKSGALTLKRRVNANIFTRN